MNLAVNSRDAMPDGGRLSLSTENVILEKQDADTLPDVTAGDFVCLSVTDTGCGMNQETKERLFEPFFTTKEVGKGTGLGLSVLYGIVKQSKGWVHVYSEEGHGTSIKIYLPAAKPAAKKDTAANATCCESILLAEDDVELRAMVVRILETAGYKPVAVATAEEALKLFTAKSGAFDLLFSDIVLPGKSGIELADELRAKNPALPVLLYSGYRDQRERWKDLNSKGYHFTQKPFTVAGLLAAVNGAITEPV
jgi:CheY-like chemotaxis protein